MGGGLAGGDGIRGSGGYGCGHGRDGRCGKDARDDTCAAARLVNSS